MPIDMVFPGISMGVFQARFWCEHQKRSIFTVDRCHLEEKSAAILEREFSMLVGSELSERAAPVWFVTIETWHEIQAGLPKPARAFAAACGFEPTSGRCQILRDVRREVGMAEQNLDDANVGASRQEMSSETVPQRMGGDRLADPGSPARQGIGLYDLGGAKGVFPMSCRS
jgi:hypothetical protein